MRLRREGPHELDATRGALERREAADQLHDAPRSELRQVLDEEVEGPSPRDADDVVRRDELCHRESRHLGELSDDRIRRPVEVGHDERVGEPVGGPKLRTELGVAPDRVHDLDPDEALGTRPIAQARRFESRHAELGRDLLDRPAVEEVAPGRARGLHRVHRPRSRARRWPVLNGLLTHRPNAPRRGLIAVLP